MYHFDMLALAITVALQQKTFEFPKDFVGTWSGEMVWTRTAGGPSQKVPMRLKIVPTTGETYTYQLTYGEKGADDRPYLLKPVDAKKGHWQVDERNGIILDHFWVDQAFIGVFTVGGNTIFTRDRREGDTLITELTTYEAATLTKSGDKNGVPAVTSNRILSVQRCVMKRIKD
jgi:hypothetical protein